MTSNSRTADEIERDIVGERAAMSDTINDLQDKFSINAIVNDLSEMARVQGGDLGRTISDTVSRNPTAVVMTTVGLAWLFLGQGRKTKERRSGDDWYDAGRRPMDDGYQSQKAHQQTTAHDVMDRIRASAASVGIAASDLTERLSHGLENLSDDAKSRVLAARHNAYEARQSSQAAMKKGANAASGFFDDQPLVMGALAMAAGAAIGGLMPHSRMEDNAMGAASDQLYADAQALYREERDKAVTAAKVAATDVKDEVKDAADDLKGLVPEDKNIGQVIVDRTAEAAKRVVDHATGSASGKPKGSPQV